MIFTRGRSTSTWALTFRFQRDEPLHHWNVVVQIGRHWWSWQNRMRTDYSHTKERVW